MKKIPINTPSELLGALTILFPQYTFERNEEDLSELTYHEVLQDFIFFYSVNNSQFTGRQLKNFAALINKAVEAGGPLENAFATCFLEHLHQVKARKPLSSFLSAGAKEKLRA